MQFCPAYVSREKRRQTWRSTCPKNPKLPAIAARGSPVLVPECIPNGLGGLLASYKPLPLSSCSGEPAGVSQLPAKL